jgi:hypothetical protein
MIDNLRPPSSTITAATLAGMGMTLATEMVAQVGIELRPTLVAASVTFVSALVGYLKRENVLPLQREP